MILATIYRRMKFALYNRDIQFVQRSSVEISQNSFKGVGWLKRFCRFCFLDQYVVECSEKAGECAFKNCQCFVAKEQVSQFNVDI